MSLTHDPVDEAFLTFCRTADPAAMDTVFTATSREMFSLARWFTRNVEDAADVVQETFLAAIEHRARFLAERRVRPWLVGILTKKAHRQRERRRRQPREATGPEPADDLGDASEPAGPGNDPSDLVLQGDHAACEQVSTHMPQSDELADAAIAYQRKVSELRRVYRREARDLTGRLPAKESVAAWQEIDRACPEFMDPGAFAVRVQPIVDKLSTNKTLFPQGPNGHPAAGAELTRACNQLFDLAARARQHKVSAEEIATGLP